MGALIPNPGKINAMLICPITEFHILIIPAFLSLDLKFCLRRLLLAGDRFPFVVSMVKFRSCIWL